MSTEQSNALIALIVLVALFLVCREIVCWYWKINRIVAALEEIVATSKRHMELYESERARHE